MAKSAVRAVEKVISASGVSIAAQPGEGQNVAVGAATRLDCRVQVEADGELVYYVFDILWYDGHNLMTIPLRQRREILKQVIPAAGPIRLSESFDVSGTELIALAGKMGLEGIVAKKAESEYQTGQRSRQWLKIKTIRQQEVVIGGYTRNENSSKLFSALLVGLFHNGELIFTGPVGTGFTTKIQQEILRKLAPLKTKKCPFSKVPDYNKPSRFRPKPPNRCSRWRGSAVDPARRRCPMSSATM